MLFARDHCPVFGITTLGWKDYFFNTRPQGVTNQLRGACPFSFLPHIISLSPGRVLTIRRHSIRQAVIRPPHIFLFCKRREVTVLPQDKKGMITFESGCRQGADAIPEGDAQNAVNNQDHAHPENHQGDAEKGEDAE